MHNFEDELTCPICYSIFEDPRVLPCSHTFCKACLESILQASSNFYIWRPLRIPLKCPSCRSMNEVAPSGIDSLPVNFALRGIIEKYQQEDHPEIATCPEHYMQPLNVYCLLDKKLVCGHCLTMGQHKGHPIDDLNSAYLKEKETPQKLLQQLSDAHWTDLSHLIQKLEEQKLNSERMVQGDKEVVLQYFKELSDVLEQKKKLFLTALCDVSKRICQLYTPQIERMKELQEQQLELIALATSLQEENPLEFLEKVDDVRQRVQMLKQKPLPQILPVHIHPRAIQVLKEDWSRTEIKQIKQLLVPEMKISSKRKPCPPIEKKDNDREAELFKILNIVIVTVISVILLSVLFFNQHIITFLNEITSLYFSKVSSSVYQIVSNSLHNLKNILCHILYLMKEFIWKPVFC
ncbi:tripartite motif-containing protein 59 [Suncus etruscus]|uniref:tripartite motif-containing protein 59 n=1 Tax=Suncus etruscus TaxID=109475 RepID=UPI00210F7979|nr:tripartite motif-containing protein 59 [Suncus etruscus]XP_049641876.1 tripartite motif-containing protein 59 [Suncus etruscus]